MPSLALYLQRVSHVLRQGVPANDVAVYIPTSDLYAGFSVSNDESWDHVSVSRAIERTDRINLAGLDGIVALILLGEHAAGAE